MNPFRDTIVASPWGEAGIDVPAIHGQVLTECLNGLEHVRQHGRSAGLLLHGAAGSGKTHLLRRLRACLTPIAPTATDRRECLYVWVRLQTSPRMIWRTLRRTLVEDWFRPVVQGRSQFDRILFHRLAEIRVAEGDLEPWYEYMRENDPGGLSVLIDQIADNLHLDRDTAVAFQHIAFDRYRRDLRAWLAGQSLPAAALERLEMTEDEGTDEDREAWAREVVLMLCRLAGPNLPIVLGFDQVEALQVSPEDHDALFAFGQLISTLHDSTTNVLLISSVQSSFYEILREHAREADRDRMTSLGALSLLPLNRQEAEQLIAARLAASGVELPPEAQGSSCWPLDAGELDELLRMNHGGIAPRKLLMTCAERYEVRVRSRFAGPAQTDFTTSDSSQSDSSTSGSSTADVRPVELLRESLATPPVPVTPGVAEPSIETFLNEKWETTFEECLAQNQPDRTEDIVRHGIPLLIKTMAPEIPLVRDELLPDVELVFDTPAGKVGMSVCTQSNMTSLAGRLKRLKGQLSPARLQRLILVRDSRVPLSKTAKAARQHLQDLEQQQATIFSPSVEVLAAIDALRILLSDAKAGDLDSDQDAVSPQSVTEWLQQHLSAELRDVVSEITGQPAASTATGATSTAAAVPLEALSTLLAEQPLLPLSLAAETLNCSPGHLVELIERYPQHVGLIGNPPQVVFRIEQQSGRASTRL